MAVKQLLCFAKTSTGGVIFPRNITNRYPACTHQFAGTNYYYGLYPSNQAQFALTGAALQPNHQAFFQGAFGEFEDRDNTRVVLGLQPPQQPNPYAYVSENLDLVRQLAVELNALQATAAEQGKTLDLVIRYAAEMNVPTAENAYAGSPTKYRASFREVREIFQAEAPQIPFCFSPAIRSGLKVSGLATYWPGDDVVDLVSSSWYVGRESDFHSAVTRFKTYSNNFKNKGIPFAIDELGGCETIAGTGGNRDMGSDGDDFLKRMQNVILDLGQDGIEFEYVTIFLERKWGDSPTLSWL